MQEKLKIHYALSKKIGAEQHLDLFVKEVILHAAGDLKRFSVFSFKDKEWNFEKTFDDEYFANIFFYHTSNIYPYSLFALVETKEEQGYLLKFRKLFKCLGCSMCVEY